MPRILSIDYGRKRTGLATTDPLKIIATGLGTVETQKLMPFLKDYLSREAVEEVIIGLPLNLDDTDTDATAIVRHFMQGFSKNFPHIPITPVDERFTSKMASRAMIEMGMKKKQRQVKGTIDEIAATMMLQEYLRERG